MVDGAGIRNDQIGLVGGECTPPWRIELPVSRSWPARSTAERGPVQVTRIRKPGKVAIELGDTRGAKCSCFILTP
jgi:hypothetical protein